LSQSTKEKNAVTEIGFKQEGLGPIIIKSIQEIMGSEEVELFSSCSLKFSAMAQCVKLEIFEPCSIVNTTNKTLYVCLLDRKKKKLCSSWIEAQALTSINLNGVESIPEYILVSYSNSQELGTLKTEEAPAIKVSSLPTNLHPNKLGPLELYPSSML
jgi:hypothetical protein